jgi:hypothetical protein
MCIFPVITYLIPASTVIVNKADMNFASVTLVRDLLNIPVVIPSIPSMETVIISVSNMFRFIYFNMKEFTAGKIKLNII